MSLFVISNQSASVTACLHVVTESARKRDFDPNTTSVLSIVCSTFPPNLHAAFPKG